MQFLLPAEKGMNLRGRSAPPALSRPSPAVALPPGSQRSCGGGGKCEVFVVAVGSQQHGRATLEAPTFPGTAWNTLGTTFRFARQRRPHRDELARALPVGCRVLQHIDLRSSGGDVLPGRCAR